VEHDLLGRLLNGGDEASLAALASLRDGATYTDGGLVPSTDLLARFYRRRLRTTRRMGNPVRKRSGSWPEGAVARGWGISADRRPHRACDRPLTEHGCRGFSCCVIGGRTRATEVEGRGDDVYVTPSQAGGCAVTGDGCVIARVHMVMERAGRVWWMR